MKFCIMTFVLRIKDLSVRVSVMVCIQESLSCGSGFDSHTRIQVLYHYSNHFPFQGSNVGSIPTRQEIVGRLTG